MNPDREKLYSGLSCAAKGYLLIHINFNIGMNGVQINILPAFAGYLLLLSAIEKLSGERRDLALLRPLGLLLAGWHAVDWMFTWAGTQLGDILPAANLLMQVVTLYFHFQFLTDMAALAETYQPVGSGLDRRLRGRRAAYVVLSTVISVLSSVPAGRFEEEKVVVMILLAVAAMIVVLFIVGGLFELRKAEREAQDAETAENK